MPDGRAPKHGETFRNEALANTLEQIAARRARRLLSRRHRSHDRRLHARSRRLPALRGFGRAPLRLGRAGQRQLSRLRRVGVAAQRPGHRRAADAADSQGVRPARRRLRQPRPLALSGRGQEARVRRPGTVLRGPCVLQIADRGADLNRLRRQAAGTLINPEARRHERGGRQSRPSTRATRFI